MNKWVRADLQGYEPYNATVQPCPVVLDANESPWGLPEAVRREMADWFLNGEDLNRYPDTDSVALREAIAAFWGNGLAKENIVCGVGSDQLIDYVTKSMLAPGDVVVTAAPTFSMYGLTTRLNHGRIENYPLCRDNDFALDADGFIAFAKEKKVRLAIVCTPNNPTGTPVCVDTLRKITEALDCPVMVDEAYGEFAESETMIPFVGQYENLLVLRTFSKAYGLAGARIGYSVSQPALADAIHIVRAPYNVPTVAQVLAQAVLRNIEAFKPRIAALTEARKALFLQLRELEGIKAYSSAANFVYFETEMNVSDALAEAGIRVRVFQKGEKEKIRLSCGTAEQNDAAITVLRTCAGKR